MLASRGNLIQPATPFFPSTGPATLLKNPFRFPNNFYRKIQYFYSGWFLKFFGNRGGFSAEVRIIKGFGDCTIFHTPNNFVRGKVI